MRQAKINAPGKLMEKNIGEKILENILCMGI